MIFSRDSTEWNPKISNSSGNNNLIFHWIGRDFSKKKIKESNDRCKHFCVLLHELLSLTFFCLCEQFEESSSFLEKSQKSLKMSERKYSFRFRQSNTKQREISSVGLYIGDWLDNLSTVQLVCIHRHRTSCSSHIQHITVPSIISRIVRTNLMRKNSH